MHENRQTFRGRDLTEAIAAARQHFGVGRQEIDFEVTERAKIGAVGDGVPTVEITAWLARGLVALAVLLIVRTFDDLSHLLGVHLLDDTTTLLLSSLVVMIFFIDVQRIHGEHPLREASRRMRHMNETDLEKLREQDEHGVSWDRPVKRIL